MNRRTLLAWAAGLPFVGVVLGAGRPRTLLGQHNRERGPAPASPPILREGSRHIEHVYDFDDSWQSDPAHILSRLAEWWDSWPRREWVDPNDPFSPVGLFEIQIGHPPAIHLTAGEVREYVRELNATYPRPRSDGPFYGPGCGFHYRGIPILVSRVSDLREGAGRG